MKILTSCRLKSNLIAYFLIFGHIFNFFYISNANVLRIIGAVNQTISIPCPVHNINDTIDLILWFKGNQESALYSLDARSSSFERAKQTPIDERFSDRAYIDVTKKPSALIINNIQKSDAGNYKCRVDFRRNRTQYRTIKLNVIDGPREVAIIDSDGQNLRDIIGPYNEEGHLTLICETEKLDHPIDLFWYRENQLIDTTFEETEQRIIRNELTIVRLTREYLLNKFTCKASNSNLTVSKEASVVLELNLRPLKVKIIGPKQPVLSGDKAILICESEGSRPNATISWWARNENYEINNIDKSEYFNRKSIKDSYISSSSNFLNSDFSSKLVLYVNESFNKKQIICRAEHPILPDSSIESVYTLNVYYPPKVSLIIGSSSTREQIYEKSNVTFKCNVQSNPEPTAIQFYFNDQPIIKSNFIYNVNFTELLIQNVGIEHNGNFTCLAITEIGTGVSDPVNLKVLFSPICAETERLTYGISQLEPIDIDCKVNSIPPAHTFYWTLNSSSYTNKQINLHNFHNYIKGEYTISTLNYSAKTHLGYGTLQCYAVNSVGKQSKPCIFNIIPGTIPQKINDCIVGNQSLSTLLIKCEAGYDGGLTQMFHLEVYKSGTAKLIKKLNSTKPIFEVDGLPRSTTFVLILYAANIKGKSDTTTFIATTLPFPNKELIIITPLIAILMGVMACLICTAISIVFISKIKNPDQTKISKFTRNKNLSSFNQPETNDDDSTSNLSDIVFNNNQAINLKFNSNNFNTLNSTQNDFYTTLELLKDNVTKSSTVYKPEQANLSNKRYIMITNQKPPNIQQLNETNLPISNQILSDQDQSSINFLLLQN